MVWTIKQSIWIDNESRGASMLATFCDSINLHGIMEEGGGQKREKAIGYRNARQCQC